MISANLQKNQLMFFSVNNGVDKVKKSDKDIEVSSTKKEEFKNVFEKEVKSETKKDLKSNEKVSPEKKSKDKEEVLSTEVKEVKVSDDKEVSDEELYALKVDFVDIQNLLPIAKAIDLSVSEVSDIISKLNIPKGEALLPENLMMIYKEVNLEKDSSLNLLTDSKFLEEFKTFTNEVFNNLEELKTELKIQNPEINTELSQSLTKEENVENEIENILTNPLNVENAKNESLSDTEDAKVDTKTTEQEEVTENIVKADTTEETSDSGEMNSQSDSKNEEKKSDTKEVVNTEYNKFDIKEGIKILLNEKIGNVKTDLILSQISEEIKTTVKSDFKSLEMQLNPEHLGKVSIEVVSKEGTLTAKIMAETEAAKQSIESNLNVLKENFTNQGLKVENVEVTIASHSFEENNMNNNENTNEQGSDKSKKGKAALNEFAIQSDEEAEETLMETLNNTVSYLA